MHHRIRWRLRYHHNITTPEIFTISHLSICLCLSIILGNNRRISSYRSSFEWIRQTKIFNKPFNSGKLWNQQKNTRMVRWWRVDYVYIFITIFFSVSICLHCCVKELRMKIKELPTQPSSSGVHKVHLLLFLIIYK